MDSRSGYGRVGTGERRSISSDDAIAAMSSHGSRGQACEKWERPVRQYDAQNLDTNKAAMLAHNQQDPEWYRYVRLSATSVET